MFRCVDSVFLTPYKKFLVIYRIKSIRPFSEKNELWQILDKMPREKSHQREARISYENRKEKAVNFYSQKNVRLEVIGSGAHGAPRSVHLFTDNYRYLFNCGEGTQRLAVEYKVKLSRVPNVFITYPSWENISGLIGMALTVQSIGIPELHVHGSPSIETMFSATNKFIALRNLSLIMQECDPKVEFFDGGINIKYVLLYPSDVKLSKNFSDSTLKTHEEKDSSNKEEEFMKNTEESEDEKEGEENYSDSDNIDYYDYLSDHNEKGITALSEKSQESKKKKKRSQSQVSYKKDSSQKYAISFICRTKKIPGTLLLDKCVEFGVPPGPLLGKLKTGEDIILENGNLIKSSSVTSPDIPGAVIIVIECPSENYLDSLLKEPAFYRHQSCEKNLENRAAVVVHFSSSLIVKNPKYKEWINRFSYDTKHLFINDENEAMDSVAISRLQYKLNLLDSDIFPLLYKDMIPVSQKEGDNAKNGHIAVLCKNYDGNASLSSTTEVKKLTEESEKELFTERKYYKCESNFHIKGDTLCEVYLRPEKQYHYSNSVLVNKDIFVNEVFEIKGFKEEFEKLKLELKMMEPSVQMNKQIYPKILFLGTGSSQPSKVRGTSGILVFLDEEKTIMFDCGEGTYGQLVRFLGKEKARQIVRDVQAIYISHIHADHHLGLITILKERRLAMIESNRPNHPPVFLLAPVQLSRWLHLFCNNFEDIYDLFVLIPNAYLADNLYAVEKQKNCLESTNLKEIRTTSVLHCPNSFGVSVTHKDGWKLTYSGDTKPCPNLVTLGMNSDILIHEATMDHTSVDEARIKMHSTTTQAIDIGKQMNAKFILLTHFSQKYCYIPLFNESFTEEVGIAFDNMMIPFNKLPVLSKLKEVLKLMFSEHYTRMECKKDFLEMKRKKNLSKSPERPAKMALKLKS